MNLTIIWSHQNIGNLEGTVFSSVGPLYNRHDMEKPPFKRIFASKHLTVFNGSKIVLEI